MYNLIRNNMKYKSNKLIYYLLIEVMNHYNKIKCKAHNITHIKEVIDNSILLCDKLGISDKSLSITSAIFHDIGMVCDRKRHHIISKEYVLQDKILPLHFTHNEILTIALACEEHRSSIKCEYSSIVSKILKDADSYNNVYRTFERCIEYTINNKKITNYKDIKLNVKKHLREKYGKNGYANKFVLKESYNIFDIDSRIKCIEDDIIFDNTYNKVINNITL